MFRDSTKFLVRAICISIIYILVLFLCLQLFGCGSIAQANTLKTWDTLPITVENHKHISNLPEIVEYINNKFPNDLLELVDTNEADINFSIKSKLNVDKAGGVMHSVFYGSHMISANIMIKARYISHPYSEYIVMHELCHALGILYHIPNSIISSVVPIHADFAMAIVDFEAVVPLLNQMYFE